jgi:hypothetical protein
MEDADILILPCGSSLVLAAISSSLPAFLGHDLSLHPCPEEGSTKI